LELKLEKTFNSQTLAQSKTKRRSEEQKNKNSKIKKGPKINKKRYLEE
jgi:hypothetical protein